MSKPDPEMSEIEFYTPQDLADMFKVNPKTIARWDRLGKFERNGIRVLRTIGGHRRFRKDDVDKFFQNIDTGTLPYA